MTSFCLLVLTSLQSKTCSSYITVRGGREGGEGGEGGRGREGEGGRRGRRGREREGGRGREGGIELLEVIWLHCCVSTVIMVGLVLATANGDNG